MRTVIFSDTHLTSRFDQAQFDAIVKAIATADRVIINGDLWASYACTFEQFLNSQWSKLFPLLKSKHAVYLYGNHDPHSKSDKRANLFSDIQADEYEFNSAKQRVHVEHGHNIISSPELKYPILQRVGLVNLGRWLSSVSIKLWGPQALVWRNAAKNQSMCQAKSSLVPSSTILVCAHSHLAEASPEKQFFNDGLIADGILQYVVVENGIVSLYSTTYP